MKPVLIIAGALMALILGMIWHLNPARAEAGQVPCDALKTMLDRLAKASSEFPVMSGTLLNGKRIVVTLSRSGSFSVIETDGNVGCMVTAGEKAELDNGI